MLVAGGAAPKLPGAAPKVFQRYSTKNSKFTNITFRNTARHDFQGLPNCRETLTDAPTWSVVHLGQKSKSKTQAQARTLLADAISSKDIKMLVARPLRKGNGHATRNK